MGPDSSSSFETDSDEEMEVGAEVGSAPVATSPAACVPPPPAAAPNKITVRFKAGIGASLVRKQGGVVSAPVAAPAPAPAPVAAAAEAAPRSPPRKRLRPDEAVAAPARPASAAAPSRRRRCALPERAPTR